VIAPGPSKALHEARSYGVNQDSPDDDWYRTRRLPGRADRRRTGHEEDVDLQSQKLSDEFGEAIDIAFCPPVFDPHRPSFNSAAVVQALLEGFDTLGSCSCVGVSDVANDARGDRRLGVGRGRRDKACKSEAGQTSANQGGESGSSDTHPSPLLTWHRRYPSPNHDDARETPRLSAHV
jgi:hypothetical protein